MKNSEFINTNIRAGFFKYYKANANIISLNNYYILNVLIFSQIFFQKFETQNLAVLTNLKIFLLKITVIIK